MADDADGRAPGGTLAPSDLKPLNDNTKTTMEATADELKPLMWLLGVHPYQTGLRYSGRPQPRGAAGREAG